MFGGTNEDGTMPVFRVARMSKTNKRYQKMVETETKPHIHAIRNDNLDPAIDDAITLKIFVATILLGWRNVRVLELFSEEEHTIMGERFSDADPEKRIKYLPFTAENATKLFKALPELYATLKENASKMSLFRAEEIDADSKT
jgi:hypothetical protein